MRRLERGSTSPFFVLAVFSCLALLAYLGWAGFRAGVTAPRGDLSAMLWVWLGWPWWGKALSITGPAALLVAGRFLDGNSRLSG